MGPRIDFYHDAPDRLDVAARIAHKAYAAGHRLLVVAPEPSRRDAIDRLLWTFAPLAFVPHCRADDRLAPETPVLIAGRVADAADAGAEVLINLGDAVPEGFERFQRVIEIVGRDDADRGPARERFRQYRDAGHAIESHRLGAGA